MKTKVGHTPRVQFVLQHDKYIAFGDVCKYVSVRIYVYVSISGSYCMCRGGE